MKKSRVTQELVNIYPSWTEVRTSDQSLGYRTFNVLAQPMERMEKSLLKMQANNYLVSANLDEIDLLYKVALPVHFDFETNNKDPAHISYIAPEVLGSVSGVWIEVEPSPLNTIEDFWYDSMPNRVTIDDVISGVNHELLTMPASGIVETGEWEHHIGGGHIWVECVGGTQYLYKDDEDNIRRGRVILHGRNREGQEVQDALVFPWDMKQKSYQEWEAITQVEVYDIRDDVDVIVTSANFNSEDHVAPWNISISENRRKVDTFYALGELDSGSTIDHKGYITDEWQQLVLGFVDKEVKERWELLDDSMDSVSGIDLTVQPFTENAWIVAEDKMLYCYDLRHDMFDNVSLIKDKTPGSNVRIDVENTRVVLHDDIAIIPWHARPLKEIKKWRMWYQTPGGIKYGLLNGTTVDFESNFWVVGVQLKRTIGDYFTLEATERGEYLFVLEAEFLDSEVHTDKVLVRVQYKQPKTSLDLSTYITEDILGIDFDADQKLWVRTAEKYYQIGLHTDIMLVDFDRKILYFKELYDSVRIPS